LGNYLISHAGAVESTLMIGFVPSSTAASGVKGAGPTQLPIHREEVPAQPQPSKTLESLTTLSYSTVKLDGTPASALHVS
jgi:hypothetical protein